MPAVSSSLNHAALEKLRDLPAGDRAALPVQCPSLRACLERVPGPRDPRGVRHTLTSLLLAAAAVVLAALRNLAIGALKTGGHRSIAAASRYHARDATRTLATLGLNPA